MKRRVTGILLMCLLLTGCGFLDGSYVSVTPHQEQRQSGSLDTVSASNYLDLMEALKDMVASGTENATIHLAEYPANAVDSGMAVAMRYVTENDPIGAYAVDSISYEQGYRGGEPAVAVSITYLHSRSEIRRIRTVENMEEAERLTVDALEKYEAGTVMLVKEFSALDFTQLVEDMAQEKPQLMMEQPQVAVGIYGNGRQRVVELNFTYQTGRDSLRQMQSQVKPVFDAAVLYVSGDASDWQKYSQLYGFLMERFDYTLETSITPAYSLLHHGVGDSRAFATVYAAMCRAAGLECLVVKGTRAGEPWTWNMVCDNGEYYHVDLLRCSEQGRYLEKTDIQMQGYVWDYSGYPVCTGYIEPHQEDNPSDATAPVPTQDPQEEPTRETEPDVAEETETAQTEQTVPETENMEETQKSS